MASIGSSSKRTVAEEDGAAEGAAAGAGRLVGALAGAADGADEDVEGAVAADARSGQAGAGQAELDLAGPGPAGHALPYEDWQAGAPTVTIVTRFDKQGARKRRQSRGIAPNHLRPTTHSCHPLQFRPLLLRIPCGSQVACISAA